MPGGSQRSPEPQLTDGGQVLYYSTDTKAIMLVDPATGRRTAIASAAVGGFTSLGAAPGVSRDGRVVVFTGDRGNGPGVFAVYLSGGDGARRSASRAKASTASRRLIRRRQSRSGEVWTMGPVVLPSRSWARIQGIHWRQPRASACTRAASVSMGNLLRISTRTTRSRSSSTAWSRWPRSGTRCPTVPRSPASASGTESTRRLAAR